MMHNNKKVLSPENTRHFPNVVLMLGRRRRRRANIKTTLGKSLVFAGSLYTRVIYSFIYKIVQP